MSEFESRAGQRVPEVTFRTRADGAWKDVTTAELFGGKKVVLFALPGAFTPTCSSAHLPRYEELYPAFQAAGVDEVYCLSVNDAFVMNAWGEDQGAKNVKLIPDGNGEFSKGMGLLVGKEDLGFGPRSWRYAMIVDDGVIETMFIEPNKPGDPYEVSDADTVLRHLAPDAEPPAFFSLFTRAGCPHCARAKQLLDERGHPYEEIQLDKRITARSLAAVTGRTTVPQVYRDGKHIGGADDLVEYFAAEPVAAAQ